MRMVVTGGAGFVGSHVCDALLARGHTVLVIDNLSTGSLANLEPAREAGERLSFARLDVADASASAEIVAFVPEVVLHLAAQASVAVSVADPLADARANVLGTVRVLEAARAVGGTRIVYAASGGTLYGEVDRTELPLDEEHPQAPTSPYGISKRAGLDYCATYERLFGVGYTALALANVYGPRQDPRGEAGVAAIFAEHALAGQPSTIDGDGEQTRDFVFVGDVARAFVLAAERPSVGLCNVGTGRQTSVRELHASIAAAAGGVPPALHGAARPADIRHSALDPSRAAARLGWRPETPLEMGLARTFDALRTSPSRV